MSERFGAICAILALLILSAACRGGDPTSESDLTWDEPLQPGITWNLKLLNGKPLIEGTSITLGLSEDSLGGTDGCNSYGRGWSEDDAPRYAAFITHFDAQLAEGIFSAHNIFSTLVLCEGIKGMMEQADAYYESLRRGRRFRIQGGWLEILDEDRQSMLLFERQSPLPGHQPTLADTQWSMTGNQEPVTLAFLNDKFAVILGECLNRIAGYRPRGRLLHFYSIHSWAFQEECPEEDSSDSLWGAQQYSVIGKEGSEKLIIGTRSDQTLTLQAYPSSTSDAGQTEWSLEKIVDISPHESGQPRIWDVIEGSTISFRFQENSVSGSAGCNSYQASLEVIEENITIGPPSVTELSCAHLEFNERVMNQESRFLDLLPQITRAVTGADRLFLSTGTGIYLIFEAQ